VVEPNGDDFVLEAHVHAVERLIIGEGYLERNVLEAFVKVKMAYKGRDGGFHAGEKEIDALRRQQHGSFEAQIRTNAPQHRLQ